MPRNSGWKTDFDGALRLEAGDVILRVKEFQEGCEWGVYSYGVRRWTGVYEGEGSLENAKKAASRGALRVILAQIDAPEAAIDAVIRIAEYKAEEENGG